LRGNMAANETDQSIDSMPSRIFSRGRSCPRRVFFVVVVGGKIDLFPFKTI
jgi:hypothetical protein